MFVTANFIQGTAKIIGQFGSIVEIETTTPKNYKEWEIIDTDGSIAKLKAEHANKTKKTKGLKYVLDKEEYMIPLSSDDAVGLMQVSSAFSVGVTETNIKFSNGTIVPMTPDVFPAFAKWFVNERNKLFV